MDDFPFKKDIYHENISNKKYLARKKRAKEKSAWLYDRKNEDKISWDNIWKPNISKKLCYFWLVWWIKQEVQWKVFNLVELKNWYKYLWEISSDLPKELADDLVIWDIIEFKWENNKWEILFRKKRINYLSRYKSDADRFTLANRVEQVIAANIDLAVIVASAKNPKFHPNLIDRYIMICQNGWVKPLICITKSDLEELNHPILNWYKEKLWIQVIETSNVNWKWLNELKEALKNKTIVFVWNSWVWKSTLTNHFLWEELINTKTVSEKSWQWRHTTTGSCLYEWDKNSYIIDTPWIRSLEVFEIWKDELKFHYKEFDSYAVLCKYNDCNHIHEPWCKVKEAVESWMISKDRYENYIRIYEDLL